MSMPSIQGDIEKDASKSLPFADIGRRWEPGSARARACVCVCVCVCVVVVVVGGAASHLRADHAVAHERPFQPHVRNGGGSRHVKRVDGVAPREEGRPVHVHAHVSGGAEVDLSAEPALRMTGSVLASGCGC